MWLKHFLWHQIYTEKVMLQKTVQKNFIYVDIFFKNNQKSDLDIQKINNSLCKKRRARNA